MNINDLFQELQNSNIPFEEVTINKRNRSIKLNILTSDSETIKNANNILINHFKKMNNYSTSVAYEIKE